MCELAERRRGRGGAFEERRRDEVIGALCVVTRGALCGGLGLFGAGLGWIDLRSFRGR